MRKVCMEIGGGQGYRNGGRCPRRENTKALGVITAPKPTLQFDG